MFSNYEKIEPKEVHVLYGSPKKDEHDFYNFAKEGVVFVNLERSIAYKTQADLNIFFGLLEDNKVYIDGYLIEHSKYHLATEGILEVELIQPTEENGLKQNVLNVWTLSKKERTDGCSITKEN